MARPSKYKPEYALQAKKICELGATDKQLSDFFEVTVSTINLWKIQHPEFSESLKIGKGLPDQKVEHSLFQKAIGYSHEDVDIKVVNGEIIETPITKNYPPDTTACIFWLKNRMADVYRANPEDGSGAPKDQNITINLVDAKKPDAD